MFKYPIFRLLFKNHQNHQILLLPRYWRFSMLLRKVLLFPMKMKLVKIMTSDDQAPGNYIVETKVFCYTMICIIRATIITIQNIQN